jgi:threonine dehydrogenase-like Zn-dependent dehydrogenase
VKAITLQPGTPDSLRLEEIDEPNPQPGDLLIEVLAVGICGTDHEIIEGDLGYPPTGHDRLVLGHEAIARVVEAVDGGRFTAGDLVAPIVRRPDPVPCPNCAIGEWDMCQNGRFGEAGIRGLNGYAVQRLALPEAFAVPVAADTGSVGVLIEPGSVVAKAWEHILGIGARSLWEPRSALVTGAGPIGLLAALFALEHCEQVHVLDRATDGAKPGLVSDLGATYHHGDLNAIGDRFDVVLECTGDVELMMRAPSVTRANGIVCLAGVTDEGTSASATFARDMVLENRVMFGTVNANRRHYEEAASVLKATDRSWLERVLDRRLPVDEWEEAYRREPDTVKTVIELLPPQGGVPA